MTEARKKNRREGGRDGPLEAARRNWGDLSNRELVSSQPRQLGSLSAVSSISFGIKRAAGLVVGPATLISGRLSDLGTPSAYLKTDISSGNRL